MRPSDLNLSVRPRPAREALDLGTLLAQRHLGLLMASWALLTLPLLGVLTLLLWDHPTVVFVLFWWLKPLCDRLPLYILSRAIFGETPTLPDCLRALPGCLKGHWLSDLVWRRFTPVRSFTLPIHQLEGLSGPARARRQAILSQRDAGAATWLTLVGVHVEWVLSLGLMGVMFLMLPHQWVEQWDWQVLLQQGSDWLWLEHASNLLYALVLTLWEPIYVACGFTLYLNRRSQLEAWDLELGFRRMSERLRGSLPGAVLTLVLVAGCFGSPTDSYAAPAPEQPATAFEETPQAAQARERIESILAAEPFEHQETVTRWRLRGSDEAPGWLPDSLPRLHGLWDFMGQAALVLEILLWAVVVALVGLLAWRYRLWLAIYGGRLGHRRRRPSNRPTIEQLDLAAETLPADVATEVLRLWPSQPRTALGLLYRALLHHLVERHQLPLRASDTEAQVVARLGDLNSPALADLAERIARTWSSLAYGHRLPASATVEELCHQWRELAGERP